MTAKTCGCSKETCGCCEGTRKLTPVLTLNRPGQNELFYRVGTHGTFLETMKARLAAVPVDAPGADGQTIERFQPLRGLTTRDAGDPAIALLDGWATVGDVLSFYQERIANEGYLRTATERRSILELARLVGYTLRPGVAATVFLAYTIEDKQAGPVEIAAGARSQSIPGPGELPQSFETSDPLIARTEWNNLQVRLHRPQNITFDKAMTVEKIYVAGANVNLKTGDPLLLLFGDKTDQVVLRTVVAAEGQFENNRTEIRLQSVPAPVLAALPALVELVAALKPLASGPNGGDAQPVLDAAEKMLTNTYLGLLSAPDTWAEMLRQQADVRLDQEPLATFKADVVRLLTPKASPSKSNVTNPSLFVSQLLKPRIPQAANTLQLGRSLKAAFNENTDAQPQLLVNFAPQLKDTFYFAWSNANVNETPPALKAIYVLRAEASLFGATVPNQATFFTGTDFDGEPGHVRGELKPQSKWKPWDLADDERDDALFLDQAHEAILPQSYVLIVSRTKSGDAVQQVRRVIAMQTAPRTAYGISGPTTQLRFKEPWWTAKDENKTFDTLRATLVHCQSEELALVEEPITDDVQGQEIPLNELYNELTSGRWVIFSGERADIPGVTGVKGSELLMISGLRQDFDKNLPGDKTHTTLLLATPTAYTYRRDTLTIYGNVVKATHGETRNETLGSGDGSQALQSFVLKQPPLTFVAAPTAAGVESTLEVYVNDVEWHEADTLAGLGPRDRRFITKTDDADNTTVIFGNGEEGSRLPTGVLNVRSIYRNGIGKGGNVLAEQISLLQTRPLGVKSVLNPLRASGGADKENRDQARENAPLAVTALDRLVSLQDYADFTRTFAGIAKAAVRRLSVGRREVIHLTIAGADDIPIDPVSDLYRNLVIALQTLGDLSVAVQVDPRELVVLVLGANIRLELDYQWEPVATEIRNTLLNTFGFQKRALGQSALLCEIIGSIQNVEGVAYVDVDTFDGIHESLDLNELTKGVKRIVEPNQGGSVKPEAVVNASIAGFNKGVLHPAQLAIFTPAVTDTIVLNQIK